MANPIFTADTDQTLLAAACDEAGVSELLQNGQELFDVNSHGLAVPPHVSLVLIMIHTNWHNNWLLVVNLHLPSLTISLTYSNALSSKLIQC